MHNATNEAELIVPLWNVGEREVADIEREQGQGGQQRVNQIGVVCHLCPDRPRVDPEGG